MKNTENLKKLMTQAHLIFKKMTCTIANWSLSLKKAWLLLKLRLKLKNNEEVKFEFKKIDGTNRIAFGTLKNVSQFIKGGKSENLSILNYFDLEKVAFRCFKIENLIKVY